MRKDQIEEHKDIRTESLIIYKPLFVKKCNKFQILSNQRSKYVFKKYFTHPPFEYVVYASVFSLISLNLYQFPGKLHYFTLNNLVTTWIENKLDLNRKYFTCRKNI